jgi:glycine betaine/choline ABC-type transport system substrate-binding protein
MMKRVVCLLIVILALFVVVLAGCSSGEDGTKDTVRITHKNYTEQRLTGQMLSIYIAENTDYSTEVTELGGTLLCWNALVDGQVDMYAEFTGSAYGAILEQTGRLGTQETYDFVKNATEEQYGITWLDPLGWNNTYVLSVRKGTAEELQLQTISDLVPHAKNMVLGGDAEFLARLDGIIGLKEEYGLEFKDERGMDQGLTYAALRDGQLDVNSSFSTDGRIAKFDLVNLEDDKAFFPPYYVTPIMKIEFAEAHPDLIETLRKLGGQWTESEMQVYNLKVDEGADVEEVAREMLKDKGLID